MKFGWFWTVKISRYLCKYANLCRQHWCLSNWNCDPGLIIMNFQGWNRNGLPWAQLVNLYTTIRWGGGQHLVVLQRKQSGQVNKGIVHSEQAFWFCFMILFQNSSRINFFFIGDFKDRNKLSHWNMHLYDILIKVSHLSLVRTI